MRLKSVILGAGIASFAIAPVMANAADSARAAAPVEGENVLGDSSGSGRFVVLLLIAVAIVAGITLFGDDDPVSP